MRANEDVNVPATIRIFFFLLEEVPCGGGGLKSNYRTKSSTMLDTLEFISISEIIEIMHNLFNVRTSNL